MPNNTFTHVITHPIPRTFIDKVTAWVGLGGIRERWTSGELAWWMISAWMLGIGTGGIISWAVAG
jgi:hypothetical protein